MTHLRADLRMQMRWKCNDFGGLCYGVAICVKWAKGSLALNLSGVLVIGGAYITDGIELSLCA